ncbi:MAG: flagellar assembly protein FliW [Planctomycetota bacterium]|nr:flagellar assembly protein FliW [Planctomycetota bacterium]
MSAKLMTENASCEEGLVELPQELHVVGGFYPFASERFAVKPEEEAPPFLRLEAVDADLAFHVLDPFVVMENYAPELPEEEDQALDLQGPDETRLLAIVNLTRGAANATVNLAAPIVINTRTGRAKQVILHNAAQYEVRHRLFPV